MTDLGGGRLYRVVAPPFTDVVNSQFIDHITWLEGQAITSGCSATLYCPDGLVTRGQMATLPGPGAEPAPDRDRLLHR